MPFDTVKEIQKNVFMVKVDKGGGNQSLTCKGYVIHMTLQEVGFYRTSDTYELMDSNAAGVFESCVVVVGLLFTRSRPFFLGSFRASGLIYVVGAIGFHLHFKFLRIAIGS